MPSDTPTPGRCGAKLRHGGYCTQRPIGGTIRCRSHPGRIGIAGAKAKGQVVLELAKWGLGDAHVDAPELMLRLVSQSAARVELYGTLLGQAFAAAEELREAHRANKLVMTPDETERGGFDGGEDGEPFTESPELQAARLRIERVFSTGGVGALIGVKLDADRFGRVYAVEEGIRGLAKLESDERDRCANFVRIAIGAGLAERQVRLAEAMAVQLVAVVFGVLEDLGVSGDDLRVREVVSQRLLAIGSGSPAVVDLTAGRLGG